MSHKSIGKVGAVFLLSAWLATGCGDGDGHSGMGGAGDTTGGTGGAVGTVGTGGNSINGSGGALGSGGAVTGGNNATGGTTSSGGMQGTVGAAQSGGSPNTGGAPNTGGTGSGSGEPPDLAGTLEAHNAERRKNNIPELVWDPALAQVAQTWASKCVDAKAPMGLIDHNTGLPNNVGYAGGSVGENIYGSTANATGVAATNSWIAEKADYNYANNTCAQGKVCGHYTQVVWRNTKKVGCVLYDCAALKFRKTVVCNYSPAGNFNGQKPY